MVKVWESAARIIGGSVVGLVIDGVRASSESMNAAAQKGLPELDEEAAKQEINMAFSRHQARVAQELAIAKRIENAVEVEIEEYYDNKTKENAGLTVNAETRTGGLGLSAEGARVSKRVYRFKGSSKVEEYTKESD